MAEIESELVGACWLRLLTSDDPGYGYVATDVPELSMAVVPRHRGRGIGRELLRQTAADALTASISRISLSVERDNPARNLYAQEGFVRVIAGVDADTMVLEL